MARDGRDGRARSEFGLDGDVSYRWPTYRAIDAAVTVALYGLIATLPVIVPVLSWMRRARGATADRHGERSEATQGDRAARSWVASLRSQ